MLINANALAIPLAAKSVHTIVTSPPYYGLRDYGTAKWEGGDPECDHNPQKPDGGDSVSELTEENEKLTARIAELEEKQRWIPVSERLPECEKDVLVFWGKASDGSKIDWFGTAWRNECDDGKWCTDPIVPTHWMPLPEPPIVYGKESEE